MPPPQQDKDVTRDYRFLKLRLTEVKKSGRQAGLSFVILNAFQDLLTGSKDAKRHRCKASIVNNNSLAPCERAEFQCENGNSNIRNSGEGATHVAKINLIPSLEGRGSKGVGDNHYSSSGTMCHLLPHRGEGIKEILKHGGQSDVQDDENNFLKRTYSKDRIRPITLALSSKGRGKNASPFTLHPSLKRTYSHIHLFTYSHRKRPAFTLAEILITLGIIGVVAAMTMPVIIQNTRGKALQAQLKKAYSVLSQATQQFITDEAQIPNPQNFADPENQFFKPLAKYFNGGSYCSKSDCQDIYDKIISSYKNYPKNNVLNGTGSMENCLDDGFIMTNDAMLIVFDRGTCGVDRFLFTIDVNGYNKPPNALGHDFFVFEINPETGAVMPEGGVGTKYDNDNTRCSIKNSHGVSGTACTSKALIDKEYFNHLP